MRWLACAILIALSGCHALYLDVDRMIDQRAAQPTDVRTPVVAAPGSANRRTDVRTPVVDAPGSPNPAGKALLGPAQPTGSVIVIAADIDQGPLDEKENKMMRRLEFKESILNLKIPDIKVPSNKLPDQEYAQALAKQFPPLPALPRLPEALPGPSGRPLTLSDLQQIALRTNPKIRQAHLQIEAARGLALQAGLYPNPHMGFTSTSIGQGNQDGVRTPGQPGGYFQQNIVTMGKLSFARQAALREVEVAEQGLRQAEADVQTQVRAAYFAVLSARENHRVIRGLTELTDELFVVLLAQMRFGEAAGYEPMQIRVLAMQARGHLTVAQNRYTSAWRQLAAALGEPQMPLTALAGRIDMPVPRFDYAEVLAYVLANHSDVIAAQVGVERNRLLARLAELQPYPDVLLNASFQKDFTTPPNGVMGNVTVGVPIPLFDRNQGNIQAARALLRKAVEDNLRVRNDLTARTASAFEHYDNNRKLIEMYKKDMLPNQVQAFRAALARHAVAGGVSYNDLITSQQTLAHLIGAYLGALNDQWTAVVEIGSLLQTRDLFQSQPSDEVAPIPDLLQLYRGGLRHRAH